MKNKRWMVYYKDAEGYREGNEYIWAPTRAEALKIYRNFFNVPLDQDVVAIPVI